MTSDRGPQFVSELWSCMSNLLGTDLHPTTAYHPQANGLIERNHQDLKASLKCRLNGPNWIDELPWVLLGLRTAPKEDLRSSSAELVYGSPLTVPGDFSQTVHQDQLQGNFNSSENVSETFVPSRRRPMGRTRSSPTFQKPSMKQSLFL